MAELQAEDKKRADEIHIHDGNASTGRSRRKGLMRSRSRLLRLRLRKNRPRQRLIKNSRLKRWSYKLNRLKLLPVLSPKLPSFKDKKDELDSYLLHFERYTKNASWEKDTWAIKPSVLLTGRAMDV